MYFIFKKSKIIIISFLIILSVMLTVSFGTLHHQNSVPTAAQSFRLPVIMYHGLLESKSHQNQYMIDIQCFEEDLKYLKENGWTTIFASELIDAVKNHTPLPQKAILLTFDDGYYNNYLYAFPLLQKYHMKAVISPIVSTADKAMSEENKNPLYSQCSWKELLEMQNSGWIEIQNHTYCLHQINSEFQGAAPIPGESLNDYQKRLTEDLTKANQRIEQNLGQKPRAFIYPFGAKTEDTEKIIKEFGFEAAFDCEEKINFISSEEDLFHLHRFLRPNSISAESFFQDKIE